tara:strand:+ start:2756 stop:3970 length:1215 start_codon:yes stop_codon:yes gene_type:complete
MSYKHFNDIQNLYEAVSENDNKDQEFTKEIVTVISTSMFVEGYSTTAIEGYFQQSTADEIAERYYECLEDFAFVDDSVLTEDVEYEYVLTEESLEDLNEVIGGIVKGLATVGRKALAPAARLAGRNVRKVANAGKWSKVAAKGTKETVSQVASKGKGFLGKVKDLAGKAKDKVGKGVNFVKDKVGKVANWAKKNPGKATAAVLAPATIGGLVASKVAKNKSKNKLPIQSVEKQKENDTHTDSQGKKYPSTAEIRAKHSKASSTGNAGSSTDSGGTAGDKSKAEPKAEPKKKMHSIERRNREIHGDDKIDALKQKNKDFQAAKKKKGGMDEFAKKYPNSNTAKERAKRNRVTSVMDMESYDAFDMVSAYLIDSNQVENMDEALYVMTEMDAQTIQGIVEDFKKKA